MLRNAGLADAGDNLRMATDREIETGECMSPEEAADYRAGARYADECAAREQQGELF